MAKRRNYSRGKRNTGGQTLGSRSGRRVRKSQKARIPAGLIFWTAFLIFVAGLFFINREHIRESLENTRLLERISASAPPENGDGAAQPSAAPAAEQPPAVQNPPVQSPAVQSPPRPIEQRNPPSSAAGAAATGTAGASSAPAAGLVPSYAEQTLYFIRVEDDGEIIRSKAARRIPVSGTPFQDTLEALIAGPGAEEEGRGIISLIPPNTRILSAAIEGSTARINFSEEFQYNTAGMEGFIAQLIQIIWTATEFPNVKDVQILIEGNRIDHLGEGIPIWNPLNRQSF
ncbi:MAG: GerMN domain-containing protein [Treponema sp.]|nr:GerMN domain-containing protein [Treponema sp.]